MSILHLNETSPSASCPRTEDTDFFSSRGGSHTTNDSTEYSTTASFRGEGRLVTELRLELEMRDERIKELEGAYEELVRKSRFDQGQLQCALQGSKDDLASTLEALNALCRGARGEESEDPVAQASMQPLCETADTGNSREAIHSSSCSSTMIADCKRQLSGIINGLREEKGKLAALLRSTVAERDELMRAAEEDMKSMAEFRCEREKFAVERDELLRAAEEGRRAAAMSEREKQKLAAALKAAEAERDGLLREAEEGKKAVVISEREREKLAAALKAAEDEKTALLASKDSVVESEEKCRRPSTQVLKGNGNGLMSSTMERRKLRESSKTYDTMNNESPLLESGKVRNMRSKFCRFCPRCAVM